MRGDFMMQFQGISLGVAIFLLFDSACYSQDERTAEPPEKPAAKERTDDIPPVLRQLSKEDAQQVNEGEQAALALEKEKKFAEALRPAREALEIRIRAQ